MKTHSPWRGLEELKNTPEFQDYFHREFQDGASEWKNEFSRRQFLNLMGASLALGGLGGCTQRAEKIIPYVVTPENLVPGTPQFFATAHVLCGYARGVLVESHSGRPTKIEGNPEHPISLGAADIFDQASILGLYSTERSKKVLKKEKSEWSNSSWAEFESFLKPHLKALKKSRGRGLRILTGASSSPLFQSQLEKMRTIYPEIKWASFEASTNEVSLKSSDRVFGQRVDTHYLFEHADVVLGLDADFFFDEPASLKYARDFIQKKRVRQNKTESNRFYALECTPQMTGVASDHRLSLNSADLKLFCQMLLSELEISPSPSRAKPFLQGYAKVIAADLKKARGRSLVIAGRTQPEEIQTFAHLLNAHLGNLQKTVFYTKPVLASPSISMKDLILEIHENKVETLFILGLNPAYATPRDLNFSEILKNVPTKIHMGLENNETAKICDWHLPESHYLESWGDARSADGTVSIVQPLIVPLYESKTVHELIHFLSFQENKDGHDLVKDYWSPKTNWSNALKNGFIADTHFARLTLHPKTKIEYVHFLDTQETSSNCELVLKMDPTILDGRFSNNPWLQELPKPISKLVWENAAFISPYKAIEMGVENGDKVKIKCDDLAVTAPIWILPGQPQNSITLHFGYGQTKGGVDAYQLSRSANPFFSVCSITKIDGHHELVTTQTHHSMEGRDLAREISHAEFIDIKDQPSELVSRPPTLYEKNIEAENAWGMSIDLGSCIGCNACVIACQAENNIPVVGKEQVAKGREMHWIRIDRYYVGSIDNPTAIFQPVTCMHCEKAPCEVVCPVGATVHSDEGLNEMVYNRCVGTRYCSNNCPYKVRRFNFFEYNKMPSEISKFQKNPDVTVRSRGVMEKCTYCVQRITKVRIEATEKNRPIRDGEIKTACQATCPTNAITFGNIKDPLSAVTKLKSEPHQYAVLSELGARPRTSYLARVANRNENIT